MLCFYWKNCLSPSRYHKNISSVFLPKQIWWFWEKNNLIPRLFQPDSLLGRSDSQESFSWENVYLYTWYFRLTPPRDQEEWSLRDRPPCLPEIRVTPVSRRWRSSCSHPSYRPEGEGRGSHWLFSSKSLDTRLPNVKSGWGALLLWDLCGAEWRKWWSKPSACSFALLLQSPLGIGATYSFLKPRSSPKAGKNPRSFPFLFSGMASPRLFSLHSPAYCCCFLRCLGAGKTQSQPGWAGAQLGRRQGQQGGWKIVPPTLPGHAGQGRGTSHPSLLLWSHLQLSG